MPNPQSSRPLARILILPTNIALVTPPIEQLDALRGFGTFLVTRFDAKTDPHIGIDLGDTDLPPHSAFPAGLVPRFIAVLEASGYRVTVRDRRTEWGVSVIEELGEV